MQNTVHDRFDSATWWRFFFLPLARLFLRNFKVSIVGDQHGSMSFYLDSTPRPSPQTVVLILLENSPAMHRRFHEVRDVYIPSILHEMRLSKQVHHSFRRDRLFF
jgi:hypothetical protein